jgi:hypothetical protein
MPCWTEASTELNLDKSDRDLLIAALVAMGYRINPDEYSRRRGFEFSADRFQSDGHGCDCSVFIKNGKMSIGGPDAHHDYAPERNEMARAYSAEVIKSATKRFGWQLAKKSDRQFVATRRS